LATLGRAYLGLALSASGTDHTDAIQNYNKAKGHFEAAIDKFNASNQREDLARGILARIALHRGSGDWDAARRDMNEVEEIAEPDPMRIFLCDVALDRARLAFARIEAFAPLSGLIEGGPPAPVVPEAKEVKRLKEEAARQLDGAAEYITAC